MAYSINSEFVIEEESNSSENDVNTEQNDVNIVYSDREPFLNHLIPHDRYNIGYIVFYLLGVNTLVPWNFFITANDYWMYKFREINLTEFQHVNFSHTENLISRTDLQTSFTSYINIASAIPNTIFLIINTLISKRISLSTRIIGSQLLVIVVFFFTTSFVRVNTDGFQSGFLIITLTSVAIVNAASAVFGGSLMGIAGGFPSKYITAVTAGQALGGIFTALTLIFSLWIGASPIISGLLYFIIGDIILLLSLFAYIILERQVYFKHHISNIVNSYQTDFNSRDELNFSSYWCICKKTWQYGFCMFSIFFITFIIYPSVTILIESQNKGHGHKWNDIYFVPVVTYFIFNCGDYIGRILSGIFMRPNTPLLLIMLCLARLLFIPAFLFCNVQPRHYLPVYIFGDVCYIILTILFALTNGYLCNLVFITIPTIVNSKEKEVASAMLGAFLGIGVTVGSFVSLLVIKIL